MPTHEETERRAEALRALGLQVRAREGRLYFAIPDYGVGFYDPANGEYPMVEGYVRSAVLRVAPRCYAFVTNLDDIAVARYIGVAPRALSDGNATYVEAWINAAVAIHEAGLSTQGDR